MNKININTDSATLISNIASNNTELLTKWNCHENSIKSIDGETEGSSIVQILNANFRNNDYKVGMNGEDFVYALNNGYNSDVRRFQDYIAEHIVTGHNRGEPSAIISDNGNRIDLLGTYFYTYSTDGFNFAPSCNIHFATDVYENIMCLNFFRSNDKIYCTSVATQNGSSAGILLWEEENGTTWGDTSVVKNFINPRIIAPYEIGGITNFGNSFLFRENDVWYMLLEGAGAISGLGYQIYLLSSNTIDGTYSLLKNEPIIYEPLKDGVGNPELAMIGDTPYKCDGKYYMYYHFHNTSKGYGIYRAYSYDLLNWTIEGAMIDCRVPPYRTWTKTDNNGDLIGWSNGDQCVCEFKGRSYLFYTNNANQYIDDVPAPDYNKNEDVHIDMCIDYRPFSDILRIKP